MRNISAVEGKTATLSCTVRNLGDRRVSIWKMMMVVVMVMEVMVMVMVVMVVMVMKRMMAACTFCKEHDQLCENQEIEIFDLYIFCRKGT